MAEQALRQQLRLVDLASPEWFQSPQTSSLWLTGFRMALAEESSFAGGPLNAELDGVMAWMIFGEMSYLDSGKLTSELDDTGALRLTAMVGGMKKTSPAAWLLLIAPLDVDGNPGDEENVRQQISAGAGICAVLFGRNCIFERVFDNVIKADGTSTSGYSPVVQNPSVFARPYLQSDRLDLLRRSGSALRSAPSEERNRVRLSLHWHESALRSDGVDAFLKSWIALEVLAMPDTTNIRPINQALAEAYGESLDSATAKFQVGRLFGLRSRIVHAGEVVAIHQLIERYLHAIYSDLLCHRLGIPMETATDVMLRAHSGELEALLRG